MAIFEKVGFGVFFIKWRYTADPIIERASMSEFREKIKLKRSGCKYGTTDASRNSEHNTVIR